ncbi:MAG: Imm53 family immunity protein [Gaiellaceae bacterium]
MGEVLGALQAWYAAHCDGDWEQEFGVTIGTLEDGCWELRVDIVGTSLAGSELARDRTARTPADWLEVWCDGYTFRAVGGPENLGELLAAFARFAERSPAPV